MATSFSCNASCTSDPMRGNADDQAAVQADRWRRVGRKLSELSGFIVTIAESELSLSRRERREALNLRETKILDGMLDGQTVARGTTEQAVGSKT